MKRVLLISYQFPPHNSAATFRVRALARYLPKYGWEPVVVCNDWGAEPSDGNDTSLLQNTPDGLKVFPIRASNTRWIRWRDRFEIVKRPLAWTLRLVEELPEIAKQVDARATWATWAPRGTHYAASRLHAQTGIPWIADYRDITGKEWDHSLGAQAKRRFLFRKERAVTESAAFVTTVTPNWCNELGFWLHRDVELLTNGFAPDDFRNFAYSEAPQPHRFRIVHCGFLSDSLYRPLTEFLETVRRLIDTAVLGSNRIRCEFYGRDCPEIRAIVKRCRAEEFVDIYPRVTRREAIQAVLSASVLLFLAYSPNHWHTAKIFDYLAAGRPIVGYPRDPGGAADLIEETETGWCPESMDELEDVLLSAYEEWKNTGFRDWHGEFEAIERYSWENNAGNLASLLERLG